MGFQPIVPFGGMAGWSFLQRTQEAQRQAFEAAPEMQRDLAYFAETIGTVETAKDLVGDYRLLKVALGAFGLDDDLANKAFIEKVLDEGSIDPESFANKMVDKRYLALTKAFGFDLGTPNTAKSDFAEAITQNYKTRQFEMAVGDQDTDMRLSLALERDLGEIVASDNTSEGKWFAILGNEPLLTVFQTALNLPKEMASLDIDDQVTIMQERSDTVFGESSIDQFSDTDRMEELNRLFLVRSQVNALSAGMSSGAIALSLLQSV